MSEQQPNQTAESEPQWWVCWIGWHSWSKWFAHEDFNMNDNKFMPSTIMQRCCLGCRDVQYKVIRKW